MADPRPAPPGTPIGGDWVITGAAGQVGRLLRAGLRNRVDRLRLLDIAPLRAQAPNEAVYGVDVGELPALVDAVTGAAGIVHLAGISDEADFHDLIETNVAGTYHVLEAARRAGVPRVVFASSNHVTGRYPTSARLRPDAPVRPDSFYGVSKVAGEALARLYAEKFGLQVACLRIGSCRVRPAELRHRSTWLSPSDAVAAFVAAMTAPDLGYAVFYAVSANDHRWWDLDAGHRVGFHPRDNAEDHLEALPGELQGGVQGGVQREVRHEVQGGDMAAAGYTLARMTATRPRSR